MNLLIKVLLPVVVLCGSIFASSNAFAVSGSYYSPLLYPDSKTSQCTYPQKSGHGDCLKNMNSNSCVDTVACSVSGGVRSEMCVRGVIWCNHNPSIGTRCPIGPGKPARIHAGYDYSAPASASILAPCNGTLTNRSKTHHDGIGFQCDPSPCGKKISFYFHHNRSAVNNGRYNRGTPIGKVGGYHKEKPNAYTPHMHVEIYEGNYKSGRLMDPMNIQFDEYVCGCAPGYKKMDRLTCFTGGKTPPPGQYNTGNMDDAMLGPDGVLNDNPDAEAPKDGACIYSEVMDNYRQFGCVFCTPFRILFNTASVMAKKTYDALAKVVVGVVVVGFAIWLALVVMRFVSHFEARDPRIFVKTMLNQAFRVLVVVLLLGGPAEQIMSLTLDPLFETSLKIVQVIGGTPIEATSKECWIADGSASGSGGSGNAESGAVEGVESGSDKAGLSPEMGNGIICTIKNTQDQIMDIMAIGRVMHCLAWEKTTLIFIPNFAYLITAVLFFIAAGILLLMYPFLLVDCVLKMAIAVALLPVALGAYAFKVTSGYLSKIFGTFIEAIMTFFFLSLVLMIISQIAKGYIAEIITEDVVNGKMNVLSTVVWFAVGALKILFVMFLGWAALSDMKKFADKFAGGIGGGGGVGKGIKIGSAVGADVSAFAKYYAVDPAMKFAKKRVKSGAALAKENIGHGYRKVKSMSFTAISRRAKNDDGTDMLDEGGNQMYKTGGSSIGRAWNAALGKMQKDNPRSWLAQKFNNGLKKAEVNTHSHYRSYGYDASGNLVETKTRINRDGSKVVVQRDDFGSVATAYDKNGNVIKQTTKPAKSLKQMINKRGEIDTATVAAFVQSSLMSHTNKQLMIMETLINSRMGNYEGGRLDGRFVSRNTRQFIDDNGNQVMQIIQQNENGSVTTFTAQFKGKRVMTNVSTMDKNGKGVSYETDGIIQRKSIIDGDNVTRLYSVAEAYSNRALHAVHINGSVSDNLPKDEIMFSDNDLQEFGQQVLNHGNKAYTFTEFK